MHTPIYDSDFYDFDFPAALIAAHPTPERSASRLLYVAASGGIYDKRFNEVVDLCRRGDLLVVNNSKVIPARLSAIKRSGGKVEILIERLLTARRALVSLRSSKPTRVGATLMVGMRQRMTVEAQRKNLFIVRAHAQDFEQLLALHGTIPLPPYIKRPANQADRTRYQTVYAKQPGSVAAPTAGLHFNDALIAALKARGVEYAELTLHVGLGTFSPIHSANIAQHTMHSERLVIGDSLCQAYTRCRQRQGRVIAVGTTVVRGLESAMHDGQLKPYAGDTSLFIRPGFRFQAVDRLITNFHLPKTTLFVLVCCFAGYETMKRAYTHAIEQRYRLFSYGDAMWLERPNEIDKHEI